jgi:hypothetical protein
MGERPDEDYDYLFKVVVTGDSGVGKVWGSLLLFLLPPLLERFLALFFIEGK